jgi:hypothetical protein
MVCPDCRKAGVMFRAGIDKRVVREWHGECPGDTWCDCAHDTTDIPPLTLNP